MVHQGIYKDDEATDQRFLRNSFIQMSDIYRLKKEIDAETTQLHRDDGQSTHAWVEQLEHQGALLGFKAVTDPIPIGSKLMPETFSLMVQTKWQEKKFVEFGKHLLCIDATHNTTVYENLNLMTLIVRDHWGHGIPVAWMLASSGTEETIVYFLKLVSLRSPSLSVSLITSDWDFAQINACRLAWGSASILLCWWHVLHAWQQHFRIGDHPAVWEMLKKWICITDPVDFDKLWLEIKAQSPETLTAYLEKHWLPQKYKVMWSAVYRTGRTIFENCDTNMLVEAWHHVLKGKFLHSKRNHRMDHLLHCLVEEVLPYYRLKQARQEAGFEGVDLEVAERIKITARTLKQCQKSDVKVVPFHESFTSRTPPHSLL